MSRFDRSELASNFIIALSLVAFQHFNGFSPHLFSKFSVEDVNLVTSGILRFYLCFLVNTCNRCVS